MIYRKRPCFQEKALESLLRVSQKGDFCHPMLESDEKSL